MANRTISMNDTIHAYLLGVSVDEPEVMARLREETSKMKMAVMQIGPEQGAFMAWLARMIGAKRAIEVGVFTGYSALAVALSLPDDGLLIACDVSEEYTSVAKPYWAEAGVAHKIDLRLAPAIETLDALLEGGQAGHFDFAFIDADKLNYDHYYERCLSLLRPGGLIAIDNVLWSGSVANPDKQDETTTALRALNEKVGSDARVDAFMVPIGDGLFLARKK